MGNEFKDFEMETPSLTLEPKTVGSTVFAHGR